MVPYSLVRMAQVMTGWNSGILNTFKNHTGTTYKAKVTKAHKHCNKIQ